MFKWNFFSPRCCWIGLVFVTASALAQVSIAPSQEFWDYVEEYGDANGNVLDPLEYDQIINIKNDEKFVLKDATNDKAIDTTKVRDADMKVEQKSSSVSSTAATSAIKGAKL